MLQSTFPPMRVLTMEAHLRMLMNSLWEIYSKEELTDVVLEFEETSLNAHSVVLVAYSPLLKTILTICSNPGEVQSVRLDNYGVTAHAMQTVLNFMYTGVLIVNDDLSSLWKAADVLQMTYLKDFVRKLIDTRDASVMEAQRESTRILRIDNETLVADVGKGSGHYSDEDFVPDDDNDVDGDGSRDRSDSHRPSYEKSADHIEQEIIYKSLRANPDNFRAVSGGYECPHCNFKRKTERNLWRHFYTHARRATPRLHKTCADCGKMFINSQSYLRHRKTKHSASGAPPNVRHCEFCDYITPYLQTLETHLARRHTRDRKGNPLEKKFKCNMCDYKTYFNHALQKHIMRHKGDLPFKCDQCDYATNHNNILRKHKLRHQGSELIHAFQCKVCGKGFTTMNGLKMHKMKHEGVVPYTCTICDKGFTSRLNYVNHRFGHIGKLPYGCQVCDFECLKGVQLKKHYEEIHGLFGKNINPRYDLLGDPNLRARVAVKVENDPTKAARRAAAVVKPPEETEATAATIEGTESIVQQLETSDGPTNIIIVDESVAAVQHLSQVDWANAAQITPVTVDGTTAYTFTVFTDRL